MPKSPGELTFKYVCPEDLRDLYVNGLYGGVTPRNELYIHFYSERHPIPKKATNKISEDGKVSDQADLELGGDVVRMVQASISMNVDTAINFRNWLNDQINYIDTKNKEAAGHAK